MHARSATLAALVLFLTACATPPQKPVSIAADTLSKKESRIGVAMSPLPKPEMHIIGAGCLLCIAAANIANASLNDHTATLTADDLADLKEEIARRIRAKGGNAIVVAEPLEVAKLADVNAPQADFARKNFTPLRERYGVDKLLVIEIERLGMWRTYSAYVPTSDPKATLQGKGYVVNLSNNAYEWYLPVTILKASDKGWDEPPKFPGLTNAYFQAMEGGKDAFLQPFQ
jgi:hypothetical protein